MNIFRHLIFALFILAPLFSFPTNQNPETEILVKQAEQYYLTQYDSAIYYFNRILAQSTDNPKLKMHSLSRLSAVYANIGKTDTAIVLAYRAIEIGLNNSLDTMLAETYLRLGNFYKERDDYANAKEFYYKAIKKGYPNTSNGARGALGIIYSNEDKPDSAIIFLKQAYDFFLTRDTNSNVTLFNISSLAGQIGIIYFDMGNKEKGLQYFLESLRISRKIGNPTNIINNLLNLSIAYDMLNRPTDAENVLNEALRLSDSLKLTRLNSRVYLLKSDHFVHVNDYESAYNNLKRYHHLTDSIEKVVYRTSLQKNEVKYLKQLQDIEMKKIKIEKEKEMLYLIITGGAVGILFIAITLFLYRKIKSGLSERKKLEEQSSQLSSNLDQAREKLSALNRHLKEQNSFIEDLQRKLKSQGGEAINSSEIAGELENRKIIRNEDWHQYMEVFEMLYPNFMKELIKKTKELSEGDKRQLIMLKLKYSRKKSAEILGISPDSVKRARQRLSKKLGLNDVTELDRFVERI
jgi:tetratricopeptide (TPR) repeat protein